MGLDLTNCSKKKKKTSSILKTTLSPLLLVHHHHPPLVALQVVRLVPLRLLRRLVPLHLHLRQAEQAPLLLLLQRLALLHLPLRQAEQAHPLLLLRRLAPLHLHLQRAEQPHLHHHLPGLHLVAAQVSLPHLHHPKLSRWDLLPRLHPVAARRPPRNLIKRRHQNSLLCMLPTLLNSSGPSLPSVRASLQRLLTKLRLAPAPALALNRSKKRTRPQLTPLLLHTRQLPWFNLWSTRTSVNASLRNWNLLCRADQAVLPALP
mmetsp:Transcript_15856/g.22317  ORF Transcript_15856/g.22317 Transcript_15856/m.22317 type:complete len:261 (-) Transcript_15856:568-1350(-)